MNNKINYLPHQDEVARLMAIRDGIIAYHGLGSGKTLTSINAANSLGIPAVAVVPASLRENFKKEIDKASPEVPFDVMSYEGFSKSRPDLTGKMLILDEAHRIKNESSLRSQVVSELASKAKKRLLLTGTPIQNKPHDIGMLMNVAAGSEVMPTKEKEFNSKYLKKVNPGIIGMLMGNKVRYEVKNKKEYDELMNQYIHKYFPEKSIENFPNVNYNEIPVEMSPAQYEQYRKFEKGAGSDVRKIISSGGVASDRNMAKLNSFLNKTRQMSNVEANGELSPKFKAIMENIENQKRPSLVYSNFLDSGVEPLAQELSNRGKRVGTFTGQLNDIQKKELVDRYNKGMLDALLVSSAGAEGLDLKGTGAVHVTEPHWNDPKINQVIGRSARFNSHSHLPENERNVEVFRYISKRPKSLWDKIVKRPPTTDEYLQELSRRKMEINNAFLR